MPRQSDFVTVFETGNQALIAVAKSILDGAEIPYLVKGENLQSLFGMGQIGTGYNLLVGPVQIQVTREDESTAKELLADVAEDDGGAM
jgi:hypothetical protein